MPLGEWNEEPDEEPFDYLRELGYNGPEIEDSLKTSFLICTLIGKPLVDATEKQLDYLDNLGYEGPEPGTLWEARWLIDQYQPAPTQKQLILLGKLGYAGYEPQTLREASKIIGKLLEMTG